MPWDYRPWGCGSGSKGSCNNGWIQFEICEDGLSNKEYFNAVYKEACELTAYLCKIYKIDPKGTVLFNGTKIPTILCHADSCQLGFGSNHGDVLHWFKKHNKTMDDVRKDVLKLLNLPPEPEIDDLADPTKKVYRVRTSWANTKSPIGAYTSLNNAKAACDKAGKEYSVFDHNGLIVYPADRVVVLDNANLNSQTSSKKEFEVGDEVSLLPNSTYTSGKGIPNWVLNSKLYIREIKKSGNYVISTQKTGDITGVVEAKYVIPYTENRNTINTNISSKPFTSYLVYITADVLNVRQTPSTSAKITTQVTKNQIFTIVDEKNGWGKLKSGMGWISLAYTKKV